MVIVDEESLMTFHVSERSTTSIQQSCSSLQSFKFCLRIPLALDAIILRWLWDRDLVAIGVRGKHDYFSYSHYIFFWGGGVNRHHNLLHDRCDPEHRLHGRTGSIWFLVVLFCRFWTQRLLLAFFPFSHLRLLGLLGCWGCGCRRPVGPWRGSPRTATAKESDGVMYREKKTHPAGVFAVGDSLRSSSKEFLLYVAAVMIVGRVVFFPSASVQLQHLELSFPWIFQDSLCGDNLPRNTYNGGGGVCSWPWRIRTSGSGSIKSSRLEICRLQPWRWRQLKYFGRLLIARDCHQEERDVIGLEATLSFWSGVTVICLTLVTLNSSVRISSKMSFAVVSHGRWRITAFTSFTDFGGRRSTVLCWRQDVSLVPGSRPYLR